MQRTNPDIDIILDILVQSMEAKPDSGFIKSLHQQYCERGSLSKKQLEGLHNAAVKLNGIHPGKLATLQAIIMKKHTNHKSLPPKEITMPEPDEKIGEMIQTILNKYPEHKRVLFFQAKFTNRDVFTAIEKTELEKFYKMVKG